MFSPGAVLLDLVSTTYSHRYDSVVLSLAVVSVGIVDVGMIVRHLPLFCLLPGTGEHRCFGA